MTKTRLKHNLPFILTFGFICIFCMSCQRNEAYSRFYGIKNAEWAHEYVLDFEIDSAVIKPGKPYNISLEITNNVGYPYRNIWVFVRSDIQSDSTIVDLSKEYELADEFGKWQGSGFGSLFQSSLPLYENVVFREGHNYTLKIQHGMRDEMLKGVERVGVRVVRADRK